MHQQLSLYGSIPNNDISIVSHSLSAVSGMNPIKVFDHCAAYIPKYHFRPQLKAGEVNQIEQYRMTLRSNLIDSDLDYKIPHSLETTRDELKKLKWVMCINELPEAGKLNYISQSQYSTTIVDGDPFLLAENLEYKFLREYWVQGYQYVFGNLVVRISRILVTKEMYDKSLTTTLAGNSGQAETSEKAKETIEIDEKEESIENTYVLLDSSGKWIVKAYVNVQNVTDFDGISEASGRLERFQSEMTPLFELIVPERKIFDTVYKE